MIANHLSKKARIMSIKMPYLLLVFWCITFYAHNATAGLFNKRQSKNVKIVENIEFGPHKKQDPARFSALCNKQKNRCGGANGKFLQEGAPAIH